VLFGVLQVARLYLVAAIDIGRLVHDVADQEQDCAVRPNVWRTVSGPLTCNVAFYCTIKWLIMNLW